MTIDESEVTVMLRIKGFASCEAMAEALDRPTEEVAAVFARLVQAGLAQETKVGVRLTPAGRAKADDLLARERAELDQRVFAQCYEEFIPVNLAFKQAVTQWQTKLLDGKQVINDHTDSVYDNNVLAGLDSIHHSVSVLIERICLVAPRLGRYVARLTRALAKIRAADTRYLTAPNRDSYHSIWFELHQDLIGLSGSTREQESAAGRAH
jgi:pyruvate, orthophosphate dikinase